MATVNFRWIESNQSLTNVEVKLAGSLVWSALSVGAHTQTHMNVTRSFSGSATVTFSGRINPSLPPLSDNEPLSASAGSHQLIFRLSSAHCKMQYDVS